MAKKLTYATDEYDLDDLTAIKALADGTASETQQKRALKWIIETACKRYELPFCPDSTRDTDFMCGRQFAGAYILKLVKLNPDVLTKKPRGTKRPS